MERTEHKITERAGAWMCTCGDHGHGTRDEVSAAVEVHMIEAITSGGVVHGAYKPIFAS